MSLGVNSSRPKAVAKRMTLLLRRVPLLALVVITGWFCPISLRAEDTAATGEYQVKVAMIYNILSYVDWPAELFSTENPPLTICVYGNGPLDRVVTTLNGRQQKGRLLTVRKISTGEDVNKCQVLVINASEKAQIATLLGKIGSAAVLTISDLNGFAEVGGMIELSKERSRIRLEINLTAARQHRIKISSQLLKLARIVRDDR